MLRHCILHCPPTPPSSPSSPSSRGGGCGYIGVHHLVADGSIGVRSHSEDHRPELRDRRRHHAANGNRRGVCERLVSVMPSVLMWTVGLKGKGGRGRKLRVVFRQELNRPANLTFSLHCEICTCNDDYTVLLNSSVLISSSA